MKPRKFSTDAQRYLDGEDAGRLDQLERREADSLAQAMRAYARDLELPDESVDAATMRAIRRLGVVGRHHRFWQWLLQPQVVRMRPALAAAAVAAVVLLSSVITVIGVNRGRPDLVAAAADAQTVLVRFELRAPEAGQVALAGTFNGWSETAIPLTRNPVTGLWVATVPLPVGRHEYSFVIDSQQWMPDPLAHAQVDDGFGQVNSVIVVGPRGVTRS